MATITMAPAPPAEIPMMATSGRATKGGEGREGKREEWRETGEWPVESKGGAVLSLTRLLFCSHKMIC